MGSQIIKADRRVDLYLDWSSVVESPVYVGNRAQMLEHLVSDYREGTERYRTELESANKRLDRADKYGSSAPFPFGCAWGERGEVYQQRGTLLRADFLAFAVLWLLATPEESDTILTGILVPFED